MCVCCELLAVKFFYNNNSKGSRESEAGGSGDSVPTPPITSNNAVTNITALAMSNPIANATDIATILATTIIAILVSLIAVIITPPTTIATNTNLAASTDYHQQSFYEYLLQHE